ncbi:MAG: alpha-L-glutamate ligase-like protein [Gemmataceae bacterium]
MLWLLTAARRLARLGVLGMNRRNAECILDHNPRGKFPLVDDKLRLHRLCREIGVPTPEVYAEVGSYWQLRDLARTLQGRDDFVIKPNRGSGGRGVLVVAGRDGGDFVRHNGEKVRLDDLRQHVCDTLSGMFSLGGQPDSALVQERVRLHPAFDDVTYKGIPDVRVIVYRDEPAMAMLRLPTRQSGGRANLHQGGIGTGVDLETGITHHAVQRDRAVTRHPDTARPVVGMRVPYWREVLALSRKVAAAVGLGYVGVDVVIDARHGPLLLEANARPGLAIQIANGRGLVPRLEEIDAMLARRPEAVPGLRDARAARQAA